MGDKWSVESDIIGIAAIMKHPRKLRVMVTIVNNPGITAKEIMTKLSISTPQYLYADIMDLKKNNLISRDFSEEKGVFTFKATVTGIKIDFKDLSIEGMNDG